MSEQLELNYEPDFEELIHALQVVYGKQDRVRQWFRTYLLGQTEEQFDINLNRPFGEKWEDRIARLFDATWDQRQVDWCFHYTWSDYDKSIKGVAQRMVFWMREGIPHDFKEEAVIGFVRMYQEIKG